MEPTLPPPERAAIIGIDWGTTHRRVVALDAHGEPLAAFADDEGMLHAAGRFRAALDTALQRLPPVAPDARVLLSGMVGSAQGWHEVPYLDAAQPLDRLRDHLFAVPDAPPGLDCRIVPGVCWRGADGRIDVMRGEETQLAGAVACGRRDGVFVLPGTHSKWVQLRNGRIERFATYMTGELFALLSQHGTLAPLMGSSDDDEVAFAQGVAVAGESALSHALFECRAQVVAGGMPAASTRERVSGVLIGSEWHDALRRFAVAAGQTVTLIGAPALAVRHQRAAACLGRRLEVLDAGGLQMAAWRALGSYRGHMQAEA